MLSIARFAKISVRLSGSQPRLVLARERSVLLSLFLGLCSGISFAELI